MHDQDTAPTTVRDHHDIAMECAQDAVVAKNDGQHHIAKHFYAAALPHELAAIETLERVSGTGPETEPTRSILYLSAASLAWCAGDNPEALRLIEIGLAGTPPPRVKADLLDLRQEAV